MSETITATPTGRTWGVYAKWSHQEAPWTPNRGWHKDIAVLVSDLLAFAGEELGPGAILVSPPFAVGVSDNRQVAADGVRAVVQWSMVEGEMMCYLDRFEVVPDESV